MEIACSLLDLNPKTKEELLKLIANDLDYIHLDIEDGKFVPNTVFPYEQVANIIVDNQKYDVHLMVNDVKKYIDEFSKINPEYITFHLEVKNTLENIYYIKGKNIKVGIAINPNTTIEKLKPYLELIDLVLVMSVEPGYGGQTFIEDSLDKIEKLYYYRKEHNLKFKIEVDGGVNDKIIPKLNKCDIIVVGSFITKGDYQTQVSKIKRGIL